MNRYTAYGLSFHSEISLDEFVPGGGERDVLIRYSGEADYARTPREKDYDLSVQPECARFWFREAGAFLVRGGECILVDPAPGADPGLLRLYLEGMITAMLLYQRGLCVLHSSVVKIGDEAIAFLGHVGAGKSSIAAALHARGHAVVSDDNAAIRIEKGQVNVAPAYPYVKLYPAVAACLGYGEQAVHDLHRSQLKIAGSVQRDFVRESLPLRRLYILSRSHPPGFSPMTAAALMLELIRNSVPTRWGCAGDGVHLERCAKLARSVDAFILRTFDQLDSIPELARSIEAHASPALAACPE